MAEEHRCQEGHRLCINNCGFLGSPATMDLCSKCYRDLRLKNQQSASAKIAVEKSLISPSQTLTLTLTPSVPSPPFSTLLESSEESAADRSSAAPGRCTGCRKRVGLTGFRCRCGLVFCGSHRYPEEHGCRFDYKAAGREAIAKENPVVRAAKLDKI